MDGEPVGLWIIASDKIHPRFHQVRQKRDVTASRSSLAMTSVAAPFAIGKGVAQLGTIRPLAGFDFGIGADDRAAVAAGIGRHRRVLGFQPEAGFALLPGADAVMGSDNHWNRKSG